MTWAQLLRRVFNIDIEPCLAFDETVRTIACLAVSKVIEKILTAAVSGASPDNDSRPTRSPRAAGTSTIHKPVDNQS